MSLEPLLAASPTIQVHVAAALAALVLGVVQVLAPKGTLPHRTWGKVWALLMLLVAVSSFFIHTRRTFGPFSLIHLFSVWVVIAVPVAVWAARTNRIRLHQRFMMGLFVGGLVVTGAFTFTPGRIMHDVVFGK